MNAAIRVSRPIVTSTPASSSITPAANSIGGKGWTGNVTGKAKNFEVACSRKSSPTTMRRTASTGGLAGASASFRNELWETLCGTDLAVSMATASAGGPAHRCRAAFPRTCDLEVLCFPGPVSGPSLAADAVGGRCDRAACRRARDDRPVHANRGVHRLRRDGDRLLHDALPQRILAYCQHGRGRHPVLLRLPLHRGRRGRRVECRQRPDTKRADQVSVATL